MRRSSACVVAAMLSFADSAKVFPGACRLAPHPVLGLVVVAALALAIVRAEHGVAAAYRNARRDCLSFALAAYGIGFTMTFALAAIGADKQLSDVILLRVIDDQSIAIWIALLCAKLFPLTLLMLEASESLGDRCACAGHDHPADIDRAGHLPAGVDHVL